MVSIPPAPDTIAVRAPGRANLIGEHVDYNDGWVLPVALDLAVQLTGQRQAGPIVLTSGTEAEPAVVDPITGAGPEHGWGRYVRAVVRALLDASLPVGGVRGEIQSSVPVGAGLSSSAALELAVALAVLEEPVGALQLARVCREAERRYVGVECGIMDQLVCAAGVAGHCLFIDCREETFEAVPLPEGLAILIVHSGLTRSLQEGVYNQRRRECQAAARGLGVPSLREVTPEQLRAAEGRLDETAYRRARHVVTENERVKRTVQALRQGCVEELGPLFAASQLSLATDYQVSTAELDLLVHLAEQTPGVLAARLTGAGLGGCTVNLVRTDRAEPAGQAIVAAYQAATGRPARHWVCQAADGAVTGR